MEHHSVLEESGVSTDLVVTKTPCLVPQAVCQVQSFPFVCCGLLLLSLDLLCFPVRTQAPPLNHPVGPPDSLPDLGKGFLFESHSLSALTVGQIHLGSSFGWEVV